MENSNPIEQMKGFAEKKLRVLRENPDESGTKAYLAKMRKGVGKVPGADPEEIHLGGQNWHYIRHLHCMRSISKVVLLKMKMPTKGELALAEQQEKWQHKIRSH